MLKILTFDAPSLLAALRSGYFRRAHVRITTASSLPELLERAEVMRPEVIILVAGTGKRSVPRQLRAHLAGLRPLLLLAVPREHRALEEDLRSYDGILSLEEPELDLTRMLASQKSLAMRRQSRVRVRIPAKLFAPADHPVDAVTVDLSSAGAGLHLPCEPASEPYHVVFARPDGRRVMLGARLAWMDAFSSRAVRIGVRFLGATLRTVRMLFDLAFWEMVAEPQGKVIHLHGEITEATALSPLVTRIAEAPTLDLGDIARVNPAGVRRWLDFLQKVPAEMELRLRRVSVPIARELLLVPAMARRCVIESFYLPYECERCVQDATALITPGLALFPPDCPMCGEPMVVTDPLLILAGEAGSARSVARH